MGNPLSEMKLAHYEITSQLGSGGMCDVDEEWAF